MRYELSLVKNQHILFVKFIDYSIFLYVYQFQVGSPTHNQLNSKLRDNLLKAQFSRLFSDLEVYTILVNISFGKYYFYAKVFN